jgi:hypothetical protein
MKYQPRPGQLLWQEVDPALHPFSADDALPFVEEVLGAGLPAPAVTGSRADRFGPWARLWESGKGWCCWRHSATTPAETAKRVHAALVDWRLWLEKLASLFDELALPMPASPSQRRAAGERAVAVLVTEVVERTAAEDAWDSFCAMVLEWFLARNGVAMQRCPRLIEEAIGGRFQSWTEPSRATVAAVGHRLADLMRERA